jgi:hypothetical protein
MNEGRGLRPWHMRSQSSGLQSVRENSPLCRPFGTRVAEILPGTPVPGYRLSRPFGTDCVGFFSSPLKPLHKTARSCGLQTLRYSANLGELCGERDDFALQLSKSVPQRLKRLRKKGDFERNSSPQRLKPDSLHNSYVRPEGRTFQTKRGFPQPVKPSSA